MQAFVVGVQLRDKKEEEGTITIIREEEISEGSASC